MPITGQYTWSETKETLKVAIPLKGIAPSKVDIFVTGTTFKVNFSPYIVDVVLHAAIEPLKHKATVKDGELRVTLYKTDHSQGTWGHLEAAGMEDKDLAKAAREESLAAHNVLEKEMGDKRNDRRIEDERYALRKQMGLDQAERGRLENLKQEEKETAEKEVYDTFARMEMEKQKTTSKSSQPSSSSGDKTKKSKGVSFSPSTTEEDNSSIHPITTTTEPSKPPSQTVFHIAEEKTDLVVVESKKNGQDIFDSGSVEVLHINDDDDDDDGWEVVEEEAIIASQQASSNAENDNDNVRYIPPPRSTGSSTINKVDVDFTPRVFPTPMRESKLAEEDDWIAKNRRHLKKHGVLGKGKKGGNAPEEDPTWLKAKGDDFYRGGDYRSALNVYSAAIDADDHMVACYANRSACYLKLDMLTECRLDCLEGIKQLGDELRGAYDAGTAVEIHSLTVMLVKLLLRRGAANTQLGLFSEAVLDYERVSKILVENNETEYEAFGDGTPARLVTYPRTPIDLPGITTASLTDDIAKLTKLVAGDALKKDADALFAEGRLVEASSKYTEALALVPMHVGCLSNRSACKLALRDIHGCVEDCTIALSLLTINLDQSPPTSSSSSSSSSSDHTNGCLSVLTRAGDNGAVQDLSMLRTILPPTGSEKRKGWVIKTTLRRGAAYAQLNMLDDAVEDFRMATALDPKNEAVKSDLNKIMNYRQGKQTPQGTLPTGERQPRPDEPLKPDEED